MSAQLTKEFLTGLFKESYSQIMSNGLFIVFFFFLGPYSWHMEVLRLEIDSEL